MSENVEILLAWDQSANGSSLQNHAQIKTPFQEDPTFVREVFQTWFPVLSYSFLMTHFAASSLRLLGCGRWSFSPQTSHPRKTNLVLKSGQIVGCPDHYVSTNIWDGRKKEWNSLSSGNFAIYRNQVVNDPNFNPGESKRCIESSTLGIGYLLLVLRFRRDRLASRNSHLDNASGTAPSDMITLTWILSSL